MSYGFLSLIIFDLYETLLQGEFTLNFDRTRRIKCDETKPACLRCLKSGFTCEGYRDPTRIRWKATRSKQESVLLLEDGAWKSSYVPILPLEKWGSASTPARQPNVNLFETQKEHQYFRLFCDKVTAQLSGYFVSPIWSQLILQVSERDESVRHAIIAVGALDIVLEGSKTISHVETSAHMDEHHAFALKQYGMAIKEMRGSLALRRKDLRSTLLTCMLIICFESLHGNHESSLAQIKTGVQILEEWFQEKKPIQDAGGLTKSR